MGTGTATATPAVTASSTSAGAAELRSRPPLLVAGIVAAAFFLAFGVVHYGFYTRSPLLDTPLYERYGDAVVDHGRLPYRDFSVEYPPAALPAFAAPSLVVPARDFGAYRKAFEALMLLCGAAAAALVGLILARQGATTRRLAGGTLLAGLAPLLLGPVVLSRFDLWPAMLVAAALAALVAGRLRLGSAVLALAIVAKVYPVVLAPLALAYVWKRAGRREAGICTAVAAGAIGVAVLPFVALAPHGVWASLAGQASRPLQIESLGAGFLLAAHQAFGVGLAQVASHGSDNLAGALPDRLALLQSLAVGAALVAVWIGFARGSDDRDRFLRFCAAAICAFVAFGKVLSPQYLIWLIAPVPLVRGRRGIAAAGLLVAAMVLTQLWFPYRYISLVYGLDPRSSWLVLARDLVLVALFAVLVWPRRARRSGIALVGSLGLAAAAAAGAAAFSSPAASVPTHGGVLDETGVASTCASPKQAPAVADGTVPYDATVLPDLGGGRCVHATLTARGRDQLFAAAYRGSFDPANARARYLGDPGVCTNLAGATGRSVRFAFAARSPFAVEVEGCGSGTGAPGYTLDLRNTARPVAVFASASAAGHRVSWLARGRAVFSVYRQREGDDRLVLVGRTRGSSLTDPAHDAGRYWIAARGPGGAWAWHGPVQPRH